VNDITAIDLTVDVDVPGLQGIRRGTFSEQVIEKDNHVAPKDGAVTIDVATEKALSLRHAYDPGIPEACVQALSLAILGPMDGLPQGRGKSLVRRRKPYGARFICDFSLDLLGPSPFCDRIANKSQNQTRD
jgi:hypothetical protein